MPQRVVRETHFAKIAIIFAVCHLPDLCVYFTLCVSLWEVCVNKINEC